MDRRLALPLFALTAACATEAPTYYADAQPILEAKCATCHQAGDIGPFPMTTYAEVQAFAGAIQASIELSTMPPWQPDEACADYEGNIDLTAEEKETLLAWLDAELPEGDPADAPPPVEPPEPFAVTYSLPLPEPYTPTREPDDYRCQLIEWPAEETVYVTGLRVTPDQRAIVHHVIAFVAGPEHAEQYRQWDADEEGPGYTCYGGPTAGEGSLFDIDPAEALAAAQAAGIPPADLLSGDLTPEQLNALFTELNGGEGGPAIGGFSTIGSWVPGVPNQPNPEGTGIRIEPGSLIVAQVHYNTSTADPLADQSVIEVATAATVERQATNLAAVDLGWVSDGLVGEPMAIPAGAAEVSHSTTLAYDSLFVTMTRQTLGIPDGEPVVLHRANHHMHELGVSQRSEVRHADGSTSCLLDIPDWDFAWQGAYTLAEPVVLRPGDELWMGCTWDNSAANQPIVDGEAREPADVAWGEGTSDEMCLGGFYATSL
jgi:hypothetical protein